MKRLMKSSGRGLRAVPTIAGSCLVLAVIAAPAQAHGRRARHRAALPPTVAQVLHSRAAARRAHEHALAITGPTANPPSTVAVGQLPTGLATTNTSAYVANAQSNTLSVVSLTSQTTTATIPVGSFPDAVALSPDNSTAYVPDFKGNALSIVTLSNDTVRSVTVGSAPDGVVQAGSNVYVSNFGSGTVSIVNPVTATVTGTISLPGTNPAPSGLAASADGHELYVADSRNATTDVIDLTTASPSSVGQATVGTYPAAVTVSGTTAWVANATKGAANPGTVSRLDVSSPSSPTVTKTIPVGSHPYGIALDSRLNELLVSNSADGTVNAIDAGTGAVMDTVAVGNTPDGVAVTPDGRTAVVSNESDNTISLVQVNALARIDDQTSGAIAEATNSQQYESAYAGYTDQAADDVQVAGGNSWRITAVVADGNYANATPPGPASSFNVYVYSDTASHLPGTLVYSATAIPQIADDSTGDVTLPLSAPATLTAGRYWISVQANESFSANGSWDWDDRSPQTLSPAAWEQPGNKAKLGCPTWGVRDVCIPDSPATEPDQAFALIGEATATVTGSSAPQTAAAAPVPANPLWAPSAGGPTAAAAGEATPASAGHKSRVRRRSTLGHHGAVERSAGHGRHRRHRRRR